MKINKIKKLILNGKDEITWLEVAYYEDEPDVLLFEVGESGEWFHARLNRRKLKQLRNAINRALGDS